MGLIQNHVSLEDAQENECGQTREAGQGLPAVSTDEKAGDRGGKQREFSVLETQ